jgi:hypothetical protein
MSFKDVQLGYLATWCSAILAGLAILFNAFQLYFDKRNRNQQIDKTSGWISDMIVVHDPDMDVKSECTLINSSQAPVYNVVLTPVVINNRRPDDARMVRNSDENCGAIISVLPPGKYKVEIPAPPLGMCKSFGLEIGLSDAKHRSWKIKSNGEIKRIFFKSTLDYYNVILPCSYSNIEFISSS